MKFVTFLRDGASEPEMHKVIERAWALEQAPVMERWFAP